MKKIKKAKLVSFTITTRVIAYNTMSDEEVAEEALCKIQRNASEYLIMDNLDEVKDDIEVPYNPDIDG